MGIFMFVMHHSAVWIYKFTREWCL